eukprot:6793045-Pyramimonas_sp.AAC.1
MVAGLKGAGGKGDGKKGEAGGHKRVDLTLRLSKLHKSLDLASLREGLSLPCYVRSVEDHGYIVSFGIDGVSGRSLLDSPWHGAIHPDEVEFTQMRCNSPR